MNWRVIFASISSLMVVISVSLLLPGGVSLFYGEIETAILFFKISIVGSVLFTGLFFLLRSLRLRNQKLQVREGYLFVSIGWVLVAGVAAVPYYLSGYFATPIDAYFEAMSGLTTTGATVLTDIEVLPKGLLFWRAQTHWLGGMGIIVLTVALLPKMGIMGYQLMKAEAPGPDVDRVTYRIAQTAKILWGIYLSLTVLETLLLFLGGLSLFDAITHSFATISTGGFSTKNASVAAYDSSFVQWVITLFMILSGVNFILYFHVLKGNFGVIKKNSEFKAYFFIVIVVTALGAYGLSRVGVPFSEALRHTAFQVGSILTTTGFTSTNYETWPYWVQSLLLMLMFIGGSTGSTAGGIKVLRILTILKQGITEIYNLNFPRAVFRVSINGEIIRSSLFPIVGFIGLYFAMIFLTTLVTAFFGYDILTSFSTALVTLGNIGPGFGGVGPTQNFAHFPIELKGFFSFIMMVGRLELFTILSLFTIRFWRNW